jgi:hypothetical protein
MEKIAEPSSFAFCFLYPREKNWVFLGNPVEGVEDHLLMENCEVMERLRHIVREILVNREEECKVREEREG